MEYQNWDYMEYDLKARALKTVDNLLTNEKNSTTNDKYEFKNSEICLNLSPVSSQYNKSVNLSQFDFRGTYRDQNDSDEVYSKTWETKDSEIKIWMSPGIKKIEVSNSLRYILCYDSRTFSVIRFNVNSGFVKVFEYQRTENYLIKQIQFIENKVWLEKTQAEKGNAQSELAWVCRLYIRIYRDKMYTYPTTSYSGANVDENKLFVADFYE